MRSFNFKAFKRYEKGYYSYKNGITVKHEGKIWNVYGAQNQKMFSGDTLAECKHFLGLKQ